MENNVEKIDLDHVDWKSSREFFESLDRWAKHWINSMKKTSHITLLGLVSANQLLKLAHQ